MKHRVEAAHSDAPYIFIEKNGEFLFVDETALPGQSYRYKIGVIDGDGEYFSQTADVKLPSGRIELSQNSPNPFNPTTSIRFSTGEPARRPGDLRRER